MTSKVKEVTATTTTQTNAATMTAAQKRQCHHIIHLYAVSAAGIAGGLAQLPGSDAAPLVALEVKMVSDLADVFGISLTKTAAAALVSGLAGTTVGRAVSQWLVGWIPGWGNAINASTAAGVVESLGWAAADHFCADCSTRN